ncbi:MAG: DUF2279 domain-containing protein [Bacteroidota bacterium]
MLKKIYISWLLTGWLFGTHAQDTLKQTINNAAPDSPVALLHASAPEKKITPDKTRVWQVAGLHAALWTGSYIALDKTWYANYPRSSFHFFNDNNEWEQMDKLGHVWTSYNVGRVSAEMWEWAGLSRKKSVVYGGLSAIAYQSIIEIQDGFSSEWGFSWGDMTANLLGATAYIWQELGWKDQRLQVKMSYWPYAYGQALLERRNQLFGKSLAERALKDYNSQTYWISANLRSFFPKSKLPAWLNLSFGYNANGMLGGTENTWTDKQGNHFNRTDVPRVRHFLFAPDIDLTKIKTRSKILKTLFFTLNILKIPAPAIELDARGRFRGYLFYY